DEFGRIDKPVGLMILDLDHFKQVNDTHGHDVGDEVLRSVAQCVRGMTRYHDVVARLGGEEFAVVTPNMDAE
ncbi:MAG: GGDEF domain-containing protein, partial [Mesorhizobium sp.]